MAIQRLMVKTSKNYLQKTVRKPLKDINHLSRSPIITSDSIRIHKFFYKRRDTAGGKEEYVEFRKRRQANGDHQVMIIRTDTADNVVMRRRPRPMETEQSFAFRGNDGAPDRMGMAPAGPDRPYRSPMMRFERRNSQSFNYTNTDNEGITTHISFRVSEPMHEDLQKITGVEGGKLDINDLSLVPEFKSGKTVIMFSLPSKAVADVYLKDSEGKLVWNDKSTGGNFSKSFVLGLNGIYYLHIKQGSNMAVKKIIKEE